MMNKILIGAAIVALAGCSAGNLTQSVVNAAYVFDTRGNIESQILSANLSQDEVNTVAAAFTKLKAIREDLHNGNTEFHYNEAKKAYLEIKMVVIRHYDDYSENQRQFFNDTHLAVLEIDEDMSKIISETKVLSYIDTTLQVVALFK